MEANSPKDQIQRLAEVIDAIKAKVPDMKTNAAIAQALRYKRAGTISEYLNESKYNKEKFNNFVDLISVTFSVNPNYVFTGTGSIFINDMPYHQQRFHNMMSSGDLSDKSSGDDLRKQKAFGEREDDGLIYVPIRAQAGYAKHFTDPVFLEQLERVQTPNAPYHGDSYRYFQVEGDSMLPTFSDKMDVLAHRVEPERWLTIKDFYVYVIVFDSQILIKRVYKKSDTEYILISDNEEMYPQEKIKVRDIKELWEVKRKLDFNMAPPKRFEIKIK